MHLASPGLLGTSIDLSIITNNEQTRDFNSEFYPYNDRFVDISADDIYLRR